jgi:ATP-dependent Lon protease
LYWADWPHIPPEWSNAISRRAEELYALRDASMDAKGYIECAVLPLKDVVLFPNMVTPLFVTEDSAQTAIEEAARAQQTMIGLAVRDPEVENPGALDLYHFGTEIAVGRLMYLPDGSSSVVTQGRRRVEVVDFVQTTPYMRVRARPIWVDTAKSKETEASMRAVLTLFERCVQLNRTLSDESYIYAVNIEDPSWLADLVVSMLNLPIPERQAMLELIDPMERLQRTSLLLGRELEVLELEDQIHSRVQREVDRSQREHYLREQMKAIQTELGETDLWTDEINELKLQVEHLTLPEEVETRALKEIHRLGQMPPMSPEVAVIRTYLDWLIGLPWTMATPDDLDIKKVARVLESQHHGLEKAKERIIEYIAVKSLAPPKQRQPILCFVGPPGTGKTSLGTSIAEALGRKFVRISLGGIRDEAEIRGHRRTYIGALPGRILQAIRRGETTNPLFMLDEIDKLGRDFRGDPASALLEVLDPEQNHAFSDHYLELPFDLSKVFFITTANTTETIPPALLDRLEVLEFPGYIEEEKIIIAQQFLVPRQLEQNGLAPESIRFTRAAVEVMIREYTWEAGVRNLEREIGKVSRKVARSVAERRKTPKRITANMLSRFLGPPQISPHEAELEDQVGAATGLAWTENGGDSITVEVLLVEGKGNLQITGQVGEIMQESAQAALSYVKSRADILNIELELFEKIDVHIHIPEGAIPKDGPSAGITMVTALASALTERAVKRDVGMSGEITLRGRVLPVGGVREKVLAAYRLPLSTVILPSKNEKDMVDIPKQARARMEIKFVEHMDEVLEIALAPAKRKSRSKRKTRTKTTKSTG